MGPMTCGIQVMAIAYRWPIFSMIGPTITVPRNFPRSWRLFIRDCSSLGRYYTSVSGFLFPNVLRNGSIAWTPPNEAPSLEWGNSQVKFAQLWQGTVLIIRRKYFPRHISYRISSTAASLERRRPCLRTRHDPCWVRNDGQCQVDKRKEGWDIFLGFQGFERIGLASR